MRTMSLAIKSLIIMIWILIDLIIQKLNHVFGHALCAETGGA